MWTDPTLYDVIVVGAGHAGCEAAHVAAHMGMKTLLLTMNLDTIAKMSCNPSIGGTGKGHIVREIDALGGIMGKIADQTAIHWRLLNCSKGPAVQASRAQIDKLAYHYEMKHHLEKTPNLDLKQALIEEIIVEKNTVCGVSTQEGVCYQGQTVIICAGTFLQGLIHIGHIQYPSGRIGDPPSNKLSDSLTKNGITLARLKTGTPPRILRDSIDFEKVEIQASEENIQFSFTPSSSPLKRVDCYITYTTQETKNIILRDLKKSALFSGKIQGKGPRYCPSIEDKIVRFHDKERHQVFLEPEGLNTEEFYVNGQSSSMPQETQIQVIHSIIGLERARITRPAYAIEYDYAISGQIYPTLETKKIRSLFFAGQINGTTGYEEAAAQGLIAAINASLQIQQKPPFILSRSESYIGVMIDDLLTKKLIEPYRMFTSRAEYRLLLRQENADMRLRKYGYDLGLITKEQMQNLKKKKEQIEKQMKTLKETSVFFEGKHVTLMQLLCRPEFSYQKLHALFSEKIEDHGNEINEQIETECKYAGYISRQQKEIEKFKDLEKISIPKDFSYDSIVSLRNEARDKFKQFTPNNLLTASRLCGISPSDIFILMIALTKKHVS